MDAGENAICEEYESSLEDLTFNSKPLINVLTMLAEENSQFASSITKLIANRIYQVQQQLKLPSLYLLDSIVKNVGGDYLHLVAQILERTFTCVFEKAEEKTRRDLYKLRTTWSPYFPAKCLYDLDVAVNKYDPGWPIPSLPPQSPSIHINPKFLKKAENTGIVSLASEAPTQQENQVVEGHQQRLIELERLQEEQLKLTELEIQEHQMKRDLLIKKQQQERKLLLQQQQQDILRLRLTNDDSDSDSVLSNGPSSSTKAESKDSVNKMLNNRDPRLRQGEQNPDHIQDLRLLQDETALSREADIKREGPVIDNQDRLQRPVSNQPLEEILSTQRADLKLTQGRKRNVQQHMNIVEDPVVPMSHEEKSVTGSPKHGFHRKTNPKSNHRRRNSDEWPSRPTSYEKSLDEKSQLVRGKARKTRQRSSERRERGRGSRGRGSERNREPGKGGFPNKDDERFSRRGEPMDPRFIVDRPSDSSSFRQDWNSEIDHGDENFRPHDEPGLRYGKRRRGRGQTVYVRGSDHDKMIRARSPGIGEQRRREIVHERDRVEILEPMEAQFAGPEIYPDPEFRIREEKHFDPREPHIGEPHSKKPRPLLSDMEITELRNRKGGSPNSGRMTPPPFQEGFHGYPLDRGEEPFDPHLDDPFRADFAPPPHGEFGPPIEPHGMWEHGFEIPRELMLDHENEIMRRAERRLQSGDLTADQHHDLMDKLHQLYELQRQSEQLRHHARDMPRPHPDPEPRHMRHGPRPVAPMDRGDPILDAGPGRPMPPRYEEHPRMPPRGPPFVDSRGPPGRHDRPRFDADDPRMGRHNNDFRGHPMELDPHPHERSLPMGPMEPPVRFDGPPRRDGPSDPIFARGRPVDNIPAPRTPPRQEPGEEVAPPTPNTMMEKKAVDDLFRKLMQVGIIKVTPEPGNESPRHVPSPGPPPAEVQQPPPLPTRPVSSVLPILAAVLPQKELVIEKKEIPEIKLVPDELKRRHDGVVSTLYDGTQCSSCGLRFPGEAANIYREHLDWHFRKNRREKDNRRVAHRQWYFVVKDWLGYEEISDPDERARSSFFDANTTAVDSPDPSMETKEVVMGSGSCPVLPDDTETEAECDICCEKFEQFWEETNEEWH
ncbi:PREDICTED: pre-mRNA cleavage complex 2 protein Pcf11-like, partial [Acropora digitifera]|uniref:pre-mRNA cleavage complex 2 protein Pcf11-like n=1 Tax=Acropora digitifera TaxID=70779 RepID=UPI00077AF28E